MPQSLLAFLAMMIATTASMTQLAQSTRIREEMARSELEIMANAVALEAIELDAVPAGYVGVSTLNNVTGQKLFTVGSRQEGFDAEWETSYVDQGGDRSIAPTDTREVKITIYHPRYRTKLVEHTRLLGQ